MKNAFTEFAAVTVGGRNTGKGNIMKTSPGLLTRIGVAAVSILVVLGAISCRQVTGDDPVDPVPVERTHEVSMRDGELVFDIVFTGLEDADLPEYVRHLERRLGAMNANTGVGQVFSITNLIDQKNAHGIDSFAIIIDYEGEGGFSWDAETRTFTIGYSVLADAAETSANVPSLGGMAGAFGAAAANLFNNPPAAAMLDEATMRQIELAVRLEVDMLQRAGARVSVMKNP